MASKVPTLIITVLLALTFVRCKPWRQIRHQYAATFSEKPASNYQGLESVYFGSYTPAAYYDSYYVGEPSSGRIFGGKKIIVKKKVGIDGGGYIVGEGSGSSYGNSGNRWKKIGDKWKKIGGKWKKIGSGYGSISRSRKLISSGLGSVYGSEIGSDYGSGLGGSADDGGYLSSYGEGSESGSPYVFNGHEGDGTDSGLGFDVLSSVSDPDGSESKYTFGSDDFYSPPRSQSFGSTGGTDFGPGGTGFGPGGTGFGPGGLSSLYSLYGSGMFGSFNDEPMFLVGDDGVIGPYPDSSKPCMKFWYDENGDLCSDPAPCDGFDGSADGPSGGENATAAPRISTTTDASLTSFSATTAAATTPSAASTSSSAITAASTTPSAASTSSSAITAASTTMAGDATTVDPADETTAADDKITTKGDDDETTIESDDDDETMTEAEDTTTDGGAAADLENGDEEEAPSR